MLVKVRSKLPLLVMVKVRCAVEPAKIGPKFKFPLKEIIRAGATPVPEAFTWFVPLKASEFTVMVPPKEAALLGENAIGSRHYGVNDASKPQLRKDSSRS